MTIPTNTKPSYFVFDRTFFDESFDNFDPNNASALDNSGNFRTAFSNPKFRNAAIKRVSTPKKITHCNSSAKPNESYEKNPVLQKNRVMTIELKTALSSSSNFIEFASIVKKVKEDISFFGGRYIYAEGYKGSIDIEALASRAIELMANNYEFNQEERITRKEVVSVIDDLFEKNYSRKVTNIITRICCAIRDFFRNLAVLLGGVFCGKVSVRWQWKYSDERDSFNYYTRSQYEKVFGKPPSTPATLKGYKIPERWGPKY
ncbi:hypothetical protein [Criblamydia sequanensis]|uniref:Uncharacterized protein n=1 Tax=Candidatus Criblamydia sequanensis CRIB-18 TaxID=1437425 RepID=A0A090D2E2_9BACT|nr:hypothetical protein [Criblamydia sequanensis]CDR34248.1 Conserved hypothetical protein [Criblamydia sequanensis CRIB-18]